MTAVLVLFIVSVFGAAAVLVAVQTSGVSNRDMNSKSSLGAADGGQLVAAYRLNMLAPTDAACVNTAATAPVGGYCQDASESVGNGGTFSFQMTPVLAPGANCAGLAVQSTVGITQRCITASGTMNGISSRTQVRLASFGAAPLFSISGLLGLNGVSVSNNAQINGTVASNAAITVKNNAYVAVTSTGPGGSVTTAANGTVGLRDPANASPFVLSPVDAGNSAQPANNDNIRITHCATSTPPFDACSGVTLDANRNLTVANNGSLTLGGGTYNLCSISFLNNVTVSLAATVKTRIFVDSPDDPNSGCPAGSGNFQVANNVNIVNPSADPTALQFYVYGLNNDLNVVNFSNNSVTYATLYAPQSTVNLSNNAAVNGAVAALAVNVLNNMTFNWTTSVASLRARSTGLYYRTAWKQCPASPTVADQSLAGC